MSFLFNKKFLFLIVILVGFVAFFHRLHEAPLSGDGIGYAQIAKEMAQTGDWITPKQDGVPIFYTSKPPLLYWMMLASGNAFGFNNFSVKFPVATLALLSIILLFVFVSKYYNYTTAFFSSIILIFTQQYLHHGRSCITDGPFAFFFMVALISFYIATTERKSIYYYLMSTFIGLAIMTKQASGILIYFAIAGYITFSRDTKALKNIHFWLSFLLVPIIVLPWHYEMYKRFGDSFVKEYFCATINNIQGWEGVNDNINYTVSIKKYNFFSEWYVYLQLLINNYWPWLPFLIYGLYIKIKGCLENWKFGRMEKKDIFVLCWAIIPLIIFQIASKKNGNYLNILYPAFAVICAEALNSFTEKTVQKIIKIFIAISIIASLLFIAFPIVPNTIDPQKLKEPTKLIPIIKLCVNENENIIIRQEDWFVFSSTFLFYADRGNFTVSDKNFEKLLSGNNRACFAAYKDDFVNRLLIKYKDKIQPLTETKRTILFRNCEK